MTNLADSLKEIVQEYATFDQHTQKYHNTKKVNPQLVEAKLKTVFAAFLTQDGVELVDIDKNCKKLHVQFHPDQYERASPEIKWLIDTLIVADAQRRAEDKEEKEEEKQEEKQEEVTPRKRDERGVCFNLVTLCADIIKNPPPQGEGYMMDEIQDLIDDLKIRRNDATTLTQRALINCIISMLKSAGNYHATASTDLPPGFMQKLMKTMPYITTGVCVALYIKELSLFYALLYTFSKGGRMLGRSNSDFLRDVGYKMQQCANILSRVTMAVMELVFKLNLGVFYTGIKAYGSICSGSSSSSAIPYGEASVQCTVLALQPQYFLDVEGREFKTMPLKLIARPFELYEKQLQARYFDSIKLNPVQVTLQELQKIDGNDKMALDDKLNAVNKVIERLACDRTFNVPKSNAAEAISTTRNILTLLCEDAGIELVKDTIPAYDGRPVFGMSYS
ncbi:MAG: hypothetical protein Q8M03_12970 [Legionella sp.]|nr:hypothetical protein [Legionella sp.]